MRKIYLVTNGFPYDRNEDPFIIPELRELVKSYEVIIISCIRMNNVAIEERNLTNLIGKQISVYQYKEHRKSIWQILGSLFICLHPVFIKEAIEIIKTRTQIWGRLWRSYLFFTQSDDFYRWLKREKVIERNCGGIYYTYWNTYYCLHMGLHRKQYPQLKFVSRLHGYDLYDYVVPFGRQPFKERIGSIYDKLVFISKHGFDYYGQKYPSLMCKKKCVLCRLGMDNEKTNIYINNVPFLLVSCSKVYPLKRVALIVKGLEKISDIEMKWVHFGDGEEKEKIEHLAEQLLKSKRNIEYIFMGRKTNEEVIGYYEKNYPSCIINVSESEGSPVSLQEALAFGTPVIVTDVGGNSELLEDNGCLLPANPSPEQVASAIQYIAQADKEQYQAMRRHSYELWNKEYNRKKNTANFIKVLEGL